MAMRYPVSVPSAIPPYTRLFAVSAPDLGGVPVLASLRSGNFWFVDANNGSDVSDGRSWDTALATIGEAHTRAGERDTILVREGTYAENLVITKDYLAIVGEVTGGYGKPDIGAASGITLVVSAQGVVLQHLRLFNDSVDADLVRIEGNGGKMIDCVLDGTGTMGATRALVRMWTDDVDDDSMTGSEWEFDNVLFRGGVVGDLNLGRALIFDCQVAFIGVHPTDNHFKNCTFAENTLEDVMTIETTDSVRGPSRNLFENCWFLDKNKATYIDLETNEASTARKNVFAGCFFLEDTPNTTAFKLAGSSSNLVGCYSMVGLIDASGYD